MTTTINGNEGQIRFPIIDISDGIFPLRLKSWEQIDIGIRIRLCLNIRLLQSLQYELILSKSIFNGMKVDTASYDADEVIVDLETNDVEKCDKLDKKIRRTVGSLNVF